MSFFGNLLNRKEQKSHTKNSEDETIFNEEDIENEVMGSDSAPSDEDAGETAQIESEEFEVVEREILPAKIVCPDCGGITLEGLDFCDKCGGEL
ncbi:MAG: hypothetical protein K0S76_2581 [Herbinix sp.]|nr:hypothetical protein [Herbinix sp.]